jgi:predicted metalloprotease with PDZ domain
MSEGNHVNGAVNGARETAPRPRLCHLHIWPDYAGYGFNVSARKGLVGQFLHQVEPRSPAEAGGLRNGDRLVEVNGTNVGRENHKQVRSRRLSNFAPYLGRIFCSLDQ